MNSKLIEEVADAVLYEGYMLYPYRPSAVKNRQRWNFGVLYPKSFSEAQKSADSWFMQTQCLVRASEPAEIEIRVRFLQGVSRQIGKVRTPLRDFHGNADPEVELVDSLDAGNTVLRPWQEAIERDAHFQRLRLADLLAGPVSKTFAFPGGREYEVVKNENGCIAGSIIRTREGIEASVQADAIQCAEDIFRLTTVVSNVTLFPAPDSHCRDGALMKSLLSAHTILGIAGGRFISLIDPPATLRELASACQNVGTWPVLAGEPGAADAMLSSPIILYDYPQIAPESAGNLFDGTEIDEILTLRILTLSDDEKEAIRQSDNRARELLARTEAMPPEQLMKLHGAMRDIQPAAGSDAANRGNRP